MHCETNPTDLLVRFAEKVRRNVAPSHREPTMSDLRSEVQMERMTEISNWRSSDLDSIEDLSEAHEDQTPLAEVLGSAARGEGH